jgi:uncharacterized membrane protein YdjX (TVP38/TMEM64 family)
MPPRPPRTISAGPLIGGLLLSLFVGAIANLLSGLIGMSTGNKVYALLIGAIPGVFFIVASRAARANGFAQGLLIGGCIVALIGGACGASMVSTASNGFH